MNPRDRAAREAVLAVVLILVSVMAVSQSQGVSATPVNGLAHFPSAANVLPMANVTTTTVSNSTEATSTSSSTAISISSNSTTIPTTITTSASGTITTSGSTSSSTTTFFSTTNTATATTFTAIYAVVTTTTTSTTTSSSTTSTTQTASPDFALSASPTVVYLPPGNFVGTTNFVLTVTSIGGWLGQLQFTASALPASVSLSNLPLTYRLDSLTASWDVQVTIAASTPVGSYPLVLTVTGLLPNGPTTHTTSVTILVQSSIMIPELPQSLGLLVASLLVFTAEVTRRRGRSDLRAKGS